MYIVPRLIARSGFLEHITIDRFHFHRRSDCHKIVSIKTSKNSKSVSKYIFTSLYDRISCHSNGMIIDFQKFTFERIHLDDVPAFVHLVVVRVCSAVIDLECSQKSSFLFIFVLRKPILAQISDFILKLTFLLYNQIRERNSRFLGILAQKNHF